MINDVDCKLFLEYRKTAQKNGYVLNGCKATIRKLHREIFEKGIREYVEGNEK